MFLSHVLPVTVLLALANADCSDKSSVVSDLVFVVQNDASLTITQYVKLLTSLSPAVLLDYNYGSNVNVAYYSVNNGGAQVGIDGLECTSQAVCKAKMVSLVAEYSFDDGHTNWARATNLETGLPAFLASWRDKTRPLLLVFISLDPLGDLAVSSIKTYGQHLVATPTLLTVVGMSVSTASGTPMASTMTDMKAISTQGKDATWTMGQDNDMAFSTINTAMCPPKSCPNKATVYSDLVIVAQNDMNITLEQYLTLINTLSDNVLLGYKYGTSGLVNVELYTVDSGGLTNVFKRSDCKDMRTCNAFMKSAVAGYSGDDGAPDWTKATDPETGLLSQLQWRSTDPTVQLALVFISSDPLGKTAISNILNYQTTLVTKPTDLVILGVPFASNGTDADMSTVTDMTAISSTNQMHVYHDGEDNSVVTNAINQAMCSNGSPVSHECKAQDVVADLVIVLQSNPQLTGTEFKTFVNGLANNILLDYNYDNSEGVYVAVYTVNSQGVNMALQYNYCKEGDVSGCKDKFYEIGMYNFASGDSGSPQWDNGAQYLPKLVLQWRNQLDRGEKKLVMVFASKHPLGQAAVIEIEKYDTYIVDGASNLDIIGIPIADAGQTADPSTVQDMKEISTNKAQSITYTDGKTNTAVYSVINNAMCPGGQPSPPTGNVNSDLVFVVQADSNIKKDEYLRLVKNIAFQTLLPSYDYGNQVHVEYYSVSSMGQFLDLKQTDCAKANLTSCRELLLRMTANGFNGADSGAPNWEQATSISWGIYNQLAFWRKAQPDRPLVLVIISEDPLGAQAIANLKDYAQMQYVVSSPSKLIIIGLPFAGAGMGNPFPQTRRDFEQITTPERIADYIDGANNDDAIDMINNAMMFG